MRSIWRIFKYLKFFPKEISLNVVFNLLAILFNLSSFVMIVPFVELLFGTSAVPAAQPQFSFSQQSLSDCMVWQLHVWQAQYGIWACLFGVAALYLSCSLLSNLFRYLGLFFLSPIRNGVIQHLRDDLYHKTTILPISFFNSRRLGDLLSRMSNDLVDVEWSVVSSLQSLVKDPINVIVFSAALIFISPKLFLYFLLILPVAVFLIGAIGKSLKRNATKGQSNLGGLFAELEESVANIRTIKAFGREQQRSAEFRDSNSRYCSRMERVVVRRELSSPLSEVLGTIGLCAILIIGGSLVLKGELLPSVFILFVIIFARLIPPVQAVVKAYNSLQKGNASAARFFEVLDADEKIFEVPGAPEIHSLSDSIRYNDVSFAYQPNEEEQVYVLKHIDLTIPKGKTIALVGPSGAGKTTLVDLLPRFYDCTEGEILMDGKPIKSLNIDSLRKLVGVVSQNCILFNDSVANNIAFGREQCSLDAVRNAAKVAYADEFIEQLPEGYDTMIGDNGVTLSGGQRQRLSIARAVLKDPEILILDEATSALDNESERLVQMALDGLMKGRTSIVIAHRLSTIRNADLICVMDKGIIVEKGTHFELSQRDGLYKKLLDKQSFL